jgi:hypothetical protein
MPLLASFSPSTKLLKPEVGFLPVSTGFSAFFKPFTEALSDSKLVAEAADSVNDGNSGVVGVDTPVDWDGAKTGVVKPGFDCKDAIAFPKIVPVNWWAK